MPLTNWTIDVASATAHSKQGGWLAYAKFFDPRRATSISSNPASPALSAQAFRAESALAVRCRGAKHIVQLLASGATRIRDLLIPTLLFEHADADAQALSAAGRLDPDSILTASLHAARGLQELHRRRIVHQDLKPSNLIAFSTEGDWLFKVADLGRAAGPNGAGPFAAFTIQGDRPHAPPELHAESPLRGWFTQGRATDLYLLGSLILQLAAPSEEPLTAAVSRVLYPTAAAWSVALADGWQGRPLTTWRSAAKAIIKSRLRAFPLKERRSLARLIESLCDPDPTHRPRSAASAARALAAARSPRR